MAWNETNLLTDQHLPILKQRSLMFCPTLKSDEPTISKLAYYSPNIVPEIATQKFNSF